MNISRTTSTTPLTPAQLDKPVKTTAASTAGRPTATDRLELSGNSGILNQLKANDIRHDKVASIKSQIENGTYETPDKIDAAIDRLMDELA